MREVVIYKPIRKGSLEWFWKVKLVKPYKRFAKRRRAERELKKLWGEEAYEVICELGEPSKKRYAKESLLASREAAAYVKEQFPDFFELEPGSLPHKEKK